MAIVNTEKELSTLYEDLEKDKLVLPNFQRGFVWDRNKQKQLLASILVDLPVGSLLILEGNANDFTKRKLCYPDELIIEGECYYVLDGQQRLSTLRTMLYDVFSDGEWRDVWDHLFGYLRTRWFLRVKPNESEEDYFGYNNLQFNSLKTLTDTDIIDFVEFKVVHKTKEQEVHHPGYRPKKDNGSYEERPAFIIDSIVNSYSDENLIPLYEVYKEDSGIHKKVLVKIANSRVDRLKLLAESVDHSKSFYLNLFVTEKTNYTSDEIEVLYEQATSEDEFNESIFVDKWAELKAVWVKDFCDELNSLIDRKMAIIHLHRNEMNRAVAIFEAINRGGEPLSVYDLVVAKSAQDQSVKNLSSKIIETLSVTIELTEALSEKYFRSHTANNVAQWSPMSMKVITGNEPSKQFKELFVNTLSLLVNVKGKGEDCKVEHIKKEKILSLSSNEVNEYCNRSIQAVVRALAFVQLRCGITSAKETPYKLMLIVLSFYLDDDDIWLSKRKLDKLEYWYWVSLFGGAYFSRQNEQCREDIVNLAPLIDSGEKTFSYRESKVLDYPDYVTKDILLRKDENNEQEQGTVKRALLSFILSQCPKDFSRLGGEELLELCPWKIANQSISVELHHVIPLGSETKLGESSTAIRKDQSHPLNSTLNLAYISKEANRAIRDKSPAEYVNHIEELGSFDNYIPPIRSFQEAMRTNEYGSVLEERYELLYRAIKQRISTLID